MKIGVFNSNWSNMGNGFFAYGLIALLKRDFPQYEVYELEEPHLYTAPSNKRLKENGLQIAVDQDVDVYVFTGPMLAQILRPHFNFASLIKTILERGKKYMILSSSASEMSEAEIVATAEFLNKYPPIAFATRDEETYNKFKPLVPFCHNGICCAFLVSLVEGVAAVKRDRPYFISSFYKKPEPYFSVSEGETLTVSSLQVKPRKYMVPFIRKGLARHFEGFRGDYPKSLASHDIVRVHQGFNPFMKWFNYAQPNSFVSYSPKCYLAVYKGCDFVVSDRVHACAAALAFGHPARLLDKNDRMGIFKRMGYVRDENGVMQPLEAEKVAGHVSAFSRYLKSIFDAIGNRIG